MKKQIVLISGSLATPTMWQHQANFFRDTCEFHYLNVLDSDSITEMATRFIPIAPQQFTLIGFSMGGYVALELYRQIPQRIDQFILINSAAQALSDKGQAERERSLELIHKGKFDFLIKLIFKNSIYDKSQYERLFPLLETMAQDVGVENYKNQLNAILNKPYQLDVLPTITCPTLLMASRQDQVMPVERSESMMKQIKQAQLVYLEQCGHLAMLEQPRVMNELFYKWLF